MNAANHDDERQWRLDEALAEYMQRIDRGETVDREQFIADCADLADELRAYFVTADEVERMAGPQPGETIDSDPSRITAVPPIDIVRYFGDYELLEEIARGGMGVVYRARQVSLNRIVAVKMILSGQLATPADVERFHAEAQAAANLDHPGIVPIYEIGEHAGQHYFSMSYIAGRSLADRIAAGPLPPREAAELVQAVAQAVQYAHDKGVVHRDLKPANILLDAAKKPRVTDFGLAKHVSRVSGLTATGQVMGTPSYMPPEQAAGNLERVGPTSDVYSLGAVLYALLTGRPPFQAATPLDTLRQVIEQEPVSLRQLNTLVPRDLETIVHKCLQKNAAHRYRSADEVAADLHRFLTGEAIHARPTSHWERSWRWVRRHPATAALIAVSAVAALAVVGLLVGLRYNAQLETALALTDEQRAEAQRQRALAQDRELEARQYWYAADVTVAELNWQRTDLERVLISLDRQRPNPGQKDLRGFEWQHLWRLCHSDRHTLRGHTAGITFVAISPDGALVASASADGTVKLWNTATGAQMAMLTGHTDEVRCVVFSGDGNLVVSGSADGTVKIWDVTSGKSQCELKGHVSEVLTVALSPDGKTLASAGFGSEVQLWDFPAGTLKTCLQTGMAYVMSIAFSPDGKTLAAGGDDDSGRPPRNPQNIELWDVATAHRRIILGRGWYVTSVAFSPDGKLLAAVDDNGGQQGPSHVRLWSVADGKEYATLDSQTARATAVAFVPPEMIQADQGDADDDQSEDNSTEEFPQYAPTGLIAAANSDGTAMIWKLDSLYRPAAVIKGHFGPLACVALAAGGRLLATGSKDGTVKLWDVALPFERINRTVNMIQEASPLVSPDGRQIFVEAFDRIAILNAATGSEVGAVRPMGRAIMAIAPDGKTLAVDQPAEDGGPTLPAVNLHELNTDKSSVALLPGLASIDALDYSPDSGTLAVRGFEKPDDQTIVVQLWDTAARRLRATIRGGERDHPAWGPSLAFDPDGKSLATAGEKGAVDLWDVATGQKRRRLLGHTSQVTSLAFSPDGKALATGSSDQTVRFWDPATGYSRATLKGHKDRISSLLFSPDSKTLASASWEEQVIKLWDVSGAQERTTIQTAIETRRSYAFSPDGRSFVTSSEANTTLWQTTTGQELLTLAGYPQPVRWVGFALGGSALVTLRGQSRAGFEHQLDIWLGSQR